MPFCIKCGRELLSGESRCTCRSGDDKPRVPVSGDPAVKPRPQDVLMVLCGDRSLGIFKRIKVYAVFFRDRIVFAHLSRERERTEGRALLRGMKNKEQNLLQNIVTRLNLWIYYGERYYDMNAESILNENSSNFALRNDEVSEFFFKASQEDAEADESGSWVGEMIIRSFSGETVDMCHNYRDSNNKIWGILYDLFGETLDYKQSDVLVYLPRGQTCDNSRFC